MPKSGFPTSTVIAGHYSFEVSHLSIADLAELRRDHAEKFFEMVSVCAPLMEHSEGLQKNYGILILLFEMADAMAHAIVLATNGKVDLQTATELPAFVQISAIIEILKLTFSIGSIDALGPTIQQLMSELEAARAQDIN